MALPGRTTFLVVGAGPSGLACALSLASQGCQDIVVVDAVNQGENTSRAIVIHAATLEALETVGAAAQLIQRGVKVDQARINDRSSSILTANFAYLASYTRYPYALLLPQNVTEHVLGEQLNNIGVRVFRPFRVTAVRNNEQEAGILDVSFEGGEVIQASYVIGADGARSTIRQLAGIGFADPDGPNEQNLALPMVLGDITFSSPPNPPIATNDITGTTSPHGLVLVLPLPSSISSGYQQQDQSSETVTYRIFCSVPASEGTPPTAPPTTYLQALLDEFGPISLSSDASVNPHPVHISDTKWSARFRTHSAIAEGFFVRFGDKQKTTNAHEQNGGIIFLVGDAAHIHSPAGGQGMNLGLRDAIGLGPVLAAHLQECQQSPSVDVDNIIQEYASTRHARAISIIRLTKRMMSSARSAGNKFTVAYWLIRLVGKISWARNMMVWRLSGLGSR